MAGNSPSRMRWHSFRRYESAIYHASVIYRGTGDMAGAMKAAKQIKKYLDDAAASSWEEYSALGGHEEDSEARR